ncbi:hypothetical protein [Algoriphagus sp.]|uniref:hypothetical protein n=1 Tax=Algoriphagus sp. TaxID=1872435 RepID=UPI00391C9F07
MDFYLNQVLSAFSSMDAKELSELLNPESTFQDLPKNLFVRKVEETFKEFKKAGDAFLEVESGNCCNLTCNPTLIRTAYRFTGDKTRNYLDFRFIVELTDDGKDHSILDIFECYSLRCKERKDWYGEQIRLSIFEDEMPGYKGSPDEVIHTEIALRAESEFIEGKDKLNLDEAETWILKYMPTYEFFNENGQFEPYHFWSWNNFYWFFKGIQHSLGFFKNWEKSLVVEAIYLNLDLPDEETLIEIILNAEGILKENGEEYFVLALKEKNSFQIALYSLPFEGNLVDIFYRYWAWFAPRQETLVKKYFALNETETDEFLEDKDELTTAVNIRLLSFHLDIRKGAKDRGEDIPFGLGEKDLPPFCK